MVRLLDRARGLPATREACRERLAELAAEVAAVKARICERWDRALSSGEQRRGCPFHLFIPDLVPGVPIDAGDDWVAYRLADGSTWIDGRGSTPRPATAETFPWTSPPTRAVMAKTNEEEKGHE